MAPALWLLLATAPLSGCLARAAADVVTFPVKAASQGVDWATTSQDEADRNRGREIRRQEEREADERRRQDTEVRKAAEQAAREQAAREQAVPEAAPGRP